VSLQHTPAHLATQLALVQKQLACDERALSGLDKIMADVRENHRRTISMRIAHYTKRIEALTAAIAGSAA
jgi:hypothetical protein